MTPFLLTPGRPTVAIYLSGCDQHPFLVHTSSPQTPGAAPSATTDDSADPRGASRPPVSAGGEL